MNSATHVSEELSEKLIFTVEAGDDAGVEDLEDDILALLGRSLPHAEVPGHIERSTTVNHRCAFSWSHQLGPGCLAPRRHLNRAPEYTLVDAPVFGRN